MDKKDIYYISEDFKDIAVSGRFWPVDDYPLHYHDHYEMELVTDGQGSQFFNGVSTNLKKKDIFLLRPLDYHKIHSDGITIRHVKVIPSLLPKWIIKITHSLKNPVVINLSDEEFNKFQYLFDLLEEELKKEHEEFLDAKTSILELLFNYFLRLDNTNVLNENETVTKIIYFLQKGNHFTEKVTLDEIAEYVGYSKYYTSSIFHKQYGITIQDFIINKRIEYAKKLILETNYSMTDIILECGFSSISNFYSKFINRVGCSPLKFKKMNKKETKDNIVNEETSK